LDLLQLFYGGLLVAEELDDVGEGDALSGEGVELVQEGGRLGGGYADIHGDQQLLELLRIQYPISIFILCSKQTHKVAQEILMLL